MNITTEFITKTIDSLKIIRDKQHDDFTKQVIMDSIAVLGALKQVLEERS